ncbi:restriction endonuclease [Streptomyces shenzhenensis]|uniref:Restriction endonuclease n=2 Tax=Streptomyces shenzhenensis TaxID=943815 RepID=A0A3M0IE11_9ACTN|nr:restriction endonuclease [Streptomyces shenzhenensis]
MEWPEGSKVEIIEGIVTVQPRSANHHCLIASRIQRRLYSVIPEDWGLFQRLPLAVPERAGMLLPDIVVIPQRECLKTGVHVPAALAELVVEITATSDARHDRVTKPAAYATAGIPLYLLVDRWAPGGPTVTLYGEPKGDVYRVLRGVKFGDPVELPEPFGLTIDTGEFPAAR